MKRQKEGEREWGRGRKRGGERRVGHESGEVAPGRTLGGKEGKRERRLLNDADLGFRRHGPSLCMHPILPHLIPASCYEFNTDLISV